MTSSYRWTFAAMSPRSSSFSVQRCLNSEGDQSHERYLCAHALTYDPFRLLTICVCLPCQFIVHLLETLDCVRYAVGHFEIIAESPINCEPRGCKLQTNGVSSPRRVLTKEILTSRAATKASLHELPVNCDFAHSLKSGEGDGEWKFMSTLLSGLERHHFKKSMAKRLMCSGRTG